MVVADLDGTLLQPDLSLSKKTKEAINLLRQHDIIFTIATGRPDQLVKEVVDTLAIDIPVIMYNGSVIGHPFKRERLYEHVIDKAIVRDVITYCEQENITYMPYHRDMILSRPNPRLAFFEKRNQSLPKQQQATFKDIDQITNITDYKFHKILLIEYDPKRHQVISDIMAQKEGISVVSSSVGFIDINPVGNNKGKALIRLAEHFNVTMDEIVVFGDQDNDIEMLEVAGIGVAMQNASKDALAVADQVTDSNADDGFANWVFKYFSQ